MRCKFLPLILGAFCFGPLPLSAAVITAPAALDGHIRATGSTFSGNAVLIGKTSGTTDYMNGLFVFDPASLLPENSTIESVSFSLFVDASDPGATGTFSLYRILQDFTSSATWTQYAAPGGGDSHLWATSGATGAGDRGALLGSVEIDPNAARGTRYTFSSSAAFVSALNDAIENNRSLSLWVGIEGGAASRTIFRAVSSEGSESLRPVLNLTYTAVPEPATVAMLAIAGGIAVMMRCRKR